ncbi:ABC transporter permease [Yoonia sp. R78084]|uniref:ABC transporter permease n=1 Tax=Yoonia sp. R78084 TaxID=3093869 RepID=UPI0037DC9DC6
MRQIGAPFQPIASANCPQERPMRLINRIPSRPLAVALAVLPFVLALIAYSIASDLRLSVNPQDKLLPAISMISETALRVFTEPDRRTGDILLWLDTGASLMRLALGVGIAAAISLVLGMLIGLLPLIRSCLSGFVAVLSMIPPLAVLPILFIVFGLGEVSKVVLIVIGITPFMTRDLSQRVLEIPTEQLIKAQTIGASSLVIALRVALPQILPRLLSNVRLSLGSAWLFLIAAEAVASDVGLGYRIFLVRRYLAMDIILTYVIWITLLAFLIDWSLKTVSRKSFPWMEAGL